MQVEIAVMAFRLFPRALKIYIEYFPSSAVYTVMELKRYLREHDLEYNVPLLLRQMMTTNIRNILVCLFNKGQFERRQEIANLL